MNILVVGDDQNLAACKSKLGDAHNYNFESDHRLAEGYVDGSDVVFDFILDEDPFEVRIYAEKKAVIFVNAAKISLAELSNLTDHALPKNVFGFNGLPSFFENKLLEVTMLNGNDNELKQCCSSLSIDYLVVDDRIGLVTPRVVCMIINEAYYTVQEGTATRQDIDAAMKLGTNYPYGPFEWCGKIGIKHVYELLEAVYEDTHDERYRICPLLKKEYLMA
jgi:3-hydroxybutyryl-CoA dehydrogenase